MFGSVNQRASMSRPRNGTQTETIAMAQIVPTRKRTAIRRAQISSSPVVFMTHQVAPRRP